MRTVWLLIFFVMLVNPLLAQDKSPETTTGRLFKVIPSLRNFRPNPAIKLNQSRNEKGLVITKGIKKISPIRIYDDRPLEKDPLVQKIKDKDFKTTLAGEIENNFDGMPLPPDGPQFSPADPDIAVGTNHIVQMVNGVNGGSFKVFDKNGNTLIDQTFLASIVATPDYVGNGDGIVLYDQLADRYIISEFGTATGSTYVNSLVIAISQSNDPTQGWNLYKFTDTLFLDYPKYSVWTDTYYATTNDFTRTAPFTYLGSTIWAFEKESMIAGNPLVRVVKFRLGNTLGGRYYSMAPVNLRGTVLPPANAPGMFAFIHDDAWTNESTDIDSIGLISAKADFNNPSNSQYTIVAMPSTPFKTTVSNAPTPGSGLVSVINFRLMNRVIYRNFGTHQSIVGSQTVDAGSNVAGIRWSELRNNGSGWSIFQEGTLGGIDARRRFIGSMGLNSKGQIALGYNFSSSTEWPSIAFTGRNAGDPPGAMTYEEIDIQAGNGFGSSDGRWGDYNSLAEDPVNDSIFWFSAMYGSTRWKTKIASFRLAPNKNYDTRLVSINFPLNGDVQCVSSFTPVITVRNSGNVTINSLQINVSVDNASPTTITWTGSIPYATSQSIALPEIFADPGNHSLIIYSTMPNGVNDENGLNDTLRSNFKIVSPVSTDISEGFDSTNFPPDGWRIINPNIGSLTWLRTDTAKYSGEGSAVMNLFQYPSINHIDYLASPLLDISGADSVIVDFYRSYKPSSTDPGQQDTLMVLASVDCGKTFPVVAWKVAGNQLTTASGVTGMNGWIPTVNDWTKTSIDIKPFIGTSQTVAIAFATRNRNGQNVYIDNVNIRKVIYPQRDVMIRSIIEPVRICTRATTPIIEIANVGKDTLRSLKIIYRINENNPDTVVWAGTLARAHITRVTLESHTFPARGEYRFEVFTTEPNELEDNNNSNDTARLTFTVFDPVSPPLAESFESDFPPDNWGISSSGNPGWERNLNTSVTGLGSAWIRHFRFDNDGKAEDLYSAPVASGNVDSVYLEFDISYLKREASAFADTLEVLITSDCGKTFNSIYKKWDIGLETVTDPNYPRIYAPGDTSGFVPNSKSLWKNEKINITRWANGVTFQAVFRSKGNNGNNIFLDDINISTVTLPARLRRRGYLLHPNPSAGEFVIRHMVPPVNLQAIEVSNAAGQVVYVKRFSGNASNSITINISRYSIGVYNVKMVYDNKVITERIIKGK